MQKGQLFCGTQGSPLDIPTFFAKNKALWLYEVIIPHGTWYLREHHRLIPVVFFCNHIARNRVISFIDGFNLLDPDLDPAREWEHASGPFLQWLRERYMQQGPFFSSEKTN